VKEVGENFSTSGPENHGFSSLNSVSWNLGQEDIYKIILERGEGKVSKDGAMVVATGVHTGRSAKDKFVVRESKNMDAIWWDNAKEMSEENFDTLHKDMADFSKNKDLFVQDLFGGADLEYRLPTRIYTEYAWHFIHSKSSNHRERRRKERFCP
jgi:phosphoenolpyruvate carboxykinase (ATP)